MRARLASALLALAVSAAPSAQSPSGPAVPDPTSFFGFPLGADRRLADYASLERYVTEIAAASDRVDTLDIGPTTEGRRLVAAVVSAPGNLARLEAIRAASLRLADPRTLDETAALALVERQPVIVAIGMSVHAVEIGATQAAPELVHRLATSADPDVARALDAAVFIVFPSLNPDGHDRVVDWYRRGIGTEFEGGPMPWLDHRYAGHDINRDAFMLNLAENQALARFLYRQWHPQVFLTLHQMPAQGPRYFVPPTADPIDANYEPLIWRTMGLLGHAMALSLEEDGRAGVVQHALFDYYSPGYEDSAPIGHNTVTLLAEAASVRVASPITVAPDQLEAGRGFPDHQPRVAFPHPWPGGDWRLRDIVDYHLSAVRGLVQAVSRYRREILRNLYRTGARQVTLGLQGGPFAFIVPPEQFDPHAAAKLRSLLVDGAVEVLRALEPFRVAETVYPEGTDIILMAQPVRAYAKTLLETQRYPARRTAEGLPERPYDVAGWTLPLQMGVRVDRIDQYFEPPATRRLDAGAIAPARLWGEARRATHYVIDGRGSGASLAINRLIETGARVSWTTTPLPLQGFTYPSGSIVALDGRGVRDAVERITRELGLRATAGGGRPPSGTRPLARVRTAIYQPWTASIDEGWTRWVLERYEFPYERVTNADILRGNLRARFDAIVLPGEEPDRLLMGHAVESVPAPYAGGLGMEGAEALRQFVHAGGTLVALDSAGDLAATLVGAPLANLTRGLPPDQFFCPGSLVRIELDEDPLTMGLPRETAAFFAFSGAYARVPSTSSSPEPAAAPTVRIVGRYGAEPVLLSGWLEGGRHIAGMGAVVEVRAGAGRVVLLAFRAQHRGQTLATFRLLFNAIHTAH